VTPLTPITYPRRKNPQPPPAIVDWSDLVPKIKQATSGVYLLVQASVVVYVGQSVNPLGRLFAHAHGDAHGPAKEFERAFFLPVPERELDSVEGALIRWLRPEYNGRRKGKMCAPAQRTWTTDEKALAKYDLPALIDAADLRLPSLVPPTDGLVSAGGT